VARASRVLLPKDYLRSVIGGAAVTDRTDASATLLWDVVADGWSPAAVAAAGVPERLLPPVVEPVAVVGHNSWLSARLGRAARDVPVVAGGGDTPVAMLAVSRAATDPDATQINLGTGAQVLRRVASPYPVEAPTTHLYAAADQGWYAMAAVQNAGLALDWAARMLDLTWPQLIAAARATPAGANAELLGPIGPAVRLTGGGGRDRLVRQLLADSLAVQVRRTELRSASATGAAMLAAQAAGTALTTPAAQDTAVTPRRVDALDESYGRWCARVGAAVS
jgi:xylulokinase